MATGTIPKGMKVKEINVNNTTDGNGNVLVASTTLYMFLAKLDENSGTRYLGIPFIFTNGYSYLHVTTTSGAAVSLGTTIKGKVYYIET